MNARGLWLAVLLGACGRSMPDGDADAGAGGWLLEVDVAWDASVALKGVELRWGAGPIRKDGDTAASVRERFASRSQALAFASQLEILVGGQPVGTELVTGDACSGLAALGLDPDDYPVARLSRAIAGNGRVEAGPTVCQRQEGPTGLAVDGRKRTLSYVLRSVGSPFSATFQGATLLPRSVSLAAAGADAELVMQSPYSQPAADLRGNLLVNLGGEAAGGVTASFDACLDLPQRAGRDVQLQVQELQASSTAVSLGGSRFCCFPDGCVAVVQ
jgi:hypothetical protein